MREGKFTMTREGEFRMMRFTVEHERGHGVECCLKWDDLHLGHKAGGASPWAQLAQLALSGWPGVFASRGACRTLFALDLENARLTI